MHPIFSNDTKPRELDEFERDRHGYFRFDMVSKYLTVHSRLLQALVSQVGTHLLTNTFHEESCAIHKAEGGCNLPKVGWLVLDAKFCYFDTSVNSDVRGKWLDRLADLITHMVLEFEPMDPRESLIRAAAGYLAAAKEQADGILEVELRRVLDEQRIGPFSGEAIVSFFDRVRGHVQRETWEREMRPYRRYCMLVIDGRPVAEVEQMFADVDLGRELLRKLQDKYCRSPYESLYCCSPERRGPDDLHFWINGSVKTIKPGWFSQAEVETLLV